MYYIKLPRKLIRKEESCTILTFYCLLAFLSAIKKDFNIVIIGYHERTLSLRDQIIAFKIVGLENVLMCFTATAMKLDSILIFNTIYSWESWWLLYLIA